jgi:hypothetical protein
LYAPTVRGADARRDESIPSRRDHQPVELHIAYRVDTFDTSTTAGSVRYRHESFSYFRGFKSKAWVRFDPEVVQEFVGGGGLKGTGVTEECVSSPGTACTLPSFDEGVHELTFNGSVHCRRGERRCKLESFSTAFGFLMDPTVTADERKSTVTLDLTIESLTVTLL